MEKKIGAQRRGSSTGRERMCLWNVDAISKDGFNKSFINQNKRKEPWWWLSWLECCPVH